MSTDSGVRRAVDKFDGSPTKLAVALGDGVLRQHVEHWLKVGFVPAQHAPAVATKAGIPLWDLRPDDWHKIWPYLIGAFGAPSVPVDETKGKSGGAEHAAASDHKRTRRREDHYPSDKPSITGGR